MNRTILIFTVLAGFLLSSDRAGTVRSAEQETANQVLKAAARFQRAATNKSYAGELKTSATRTSPNSIPAGPTD